MRRITKTALAVVVLAAAVQAGAPAAQADPGGGRANAAGTALPGDGLNGAARASVAKTPDAHEKAAEANNLNESAAAKDLGSGAPVVPQKPGVAGKKTKERAGEGGGLEGTTAPSARARGPVVYQRPIAGTSSTVRFPDAASVSTATLAPYLREIVASAKRTRTVSVDARATSSSLAAAQLTMELFPDVSVPLETTVAPSRGAGFGGLTSTAYSGGGAGGTAIVSVIGNDVHATIWKGTKKYGIKPLGNGSHLVFEDGRVFPGEDEPPLSAAQSTPSGTKASVGRAGIAAATPVIDVMVAFDNSAEAAYGSIAAAEADIIDMINVSNMSYANSLNDQQLALTNIVNLNYTPNAGDGTTVDETYLTRIRTNGDGIVDSLHTDRDNNSADLVSVISNMSSWCGLARFPTSADPATNDAFSVVDFSCAVGNLSFPHELGHNMCADHDPINAGGSSPCETDGFGHFSAVENLRTIMSYGNDENGCNGCVRIPYFSNPNVAFDGWTTGILNSRNNSRVLETTDLDVSNYRAPITSPAVAGTDGLSCIFNTIEDAIAMAPAGSTIFIAPGVYPAVTANLDYNISKNLDLVKGTADCEPTAGGVSTDIVLQRNAGSTVDAVVEVTGAVTVRFDRITIEGGNSAEGTLRVASGANVTLDDSIVRNGNNPSATTGGGGVRVSGATSAFTAINDAQIENNTAVLGGGVFVDDGTVTIDDLSNVELNTSTGNGGGIYALNNAAVVVSGNADVLNNAAGAAARGGGAYLTGTSTLLVTGASSFIGFPGQDNTANLGAGVFAEGGSIVTVASGGTINANSGGFGGGLYGFGAGTILRLNDGGVVQNNTTTSNGAGVLVTSSATADFNPGSIVRDNTATGFGGGVAVFGTSTLDADGQTTGVVISGNTAGTVGGGLYVAGTAALDTVQIVDNTSGTEGGGVYITSSGVVTMREVFGCGPSTFAKEHYCNEFRDNTAGTTGGAIYATGGDFTGEQIGFIGNAAANAAVVIAFGDSVIDIKASLIINNTESIAADEALVTGHDTSSISLIGVTSASQTEALLDTDESATANTSRVLTTTGTLGLVATPTGSCNISAVAANLPNLLVAVISFTSTARTDFMPVAGASSLDRCNLLNGHNSDIDDTAVIDVAPAGANDYDVGAFEALA